MRIQTKRTGIAALVLLALLIPTASSPGQELKGRPLPDFTVLAPDGRDVVATALSTEGHWLLVYLSPESAPSSRLLRLMRDWQIPQLLSRTAIVVRGDVPTAQAYLVKRAPEEILPSLTWYADPQHQAWDALQLHGTPMLMGVANGQIMWTVAGVLSRPDSLESIVRTWMETR
jgi:hypothetical protein